ASELQPASVVLTRRLFESLASGWPDDALLVRFSDSEAAVQHQLDWVIQSIDENYKATLLSEHQAGEVWAEVGDFEKQAIRVRLSVPVSAVPAEFEKAYLAHLDCVVTADIGTGIIRVGFDADALSAVDQIKRLRASAAGAKGTLTIEKAPAGVRASADAWGHVGTTAELMRSIKARFDPQSLLNPGKFGWD
ncbi:MAG TPA: FAD-linked oxidase C-terminal domain-containing protein, partial [Blastocatellia bacterium]|nr:FAD-linked oxidase C-terminal domain-containing protein [Blastocatellia bacterium]